MQRKRKKRKEKETPTLVHRVQLLFRMVLTVNSTKRLVCDAGAIALCKIGTELLNII
jgi:hypothetical protein